MMGKRQEYCRNLEELPEWDEYLLEQSGLPGPRGNLELAHAVADVGSRKLFARYVGLDAERAPTNDPHEFLAFCGVLGMGRLLAEGDRGALIPIRRAAGDPRWRLREACAQALQRWGDVDMESLCLLMSDWAGGTLLERRAAAAALCEPRLLKSPKQARTVLEILDRITVGIRDIEDRRADGFRVLRQGLGYGWSVAVSALPEVGCPMFERWLDDRDVDIRWIVRENLKKKRLERLDADWMARCLEQINR